MSNCINFAINNYIYGEAFLDETIIPNFCEDKIEALNLVNFLSDMEMSQFVCTKLNGEYNIMVEDVDYSVSHQNIATALCLACLASVGLDEDFLRDLKFEYNFSKGIL